MERIFSNKSDAFFIDDPGGTGKSFLYRALLATVRYRGFIDLVTASSGVAASLLPGGLTKAGKRTGPGQQDRFYR